MLRRTLLKALPSLIAAPPVLLAGRASRAWQIGKPNDGDPFFGNVVLLCGFDGAFIDESPRVHTMTAGGGATIDASIFEFGTGAAKFLGTGQKVTTPDSVDWSLGNRDFTLDGSFYFDGKANNQAFIGQWDNAGVVANCAWYWFLFGGVLTFRYLSSGGAALVDITSSSFTPSLAAGFYQCAVVRTGVSTWLQYINGVRVTNSVGIHSDIINDSAAKLVIGSVGDTDSFASLDYNGRQDEIRLTLDVARYTGLSYTPAIGMFPRR